MNSKTNINHDHVLNDLALTDLTEKNNRLLNKIHDLENQLISNQKQYYDFLKFHLLIILLSMKKSVL